MNTKKKSLLLVEDEPIIAMAESKKLQMAGYNVSVALNREEAIRESEKNPDIDLILMDIDLGNGLDGTQAARKILEKRELPIVFLTSHSEQEMVEKVKSITRYGYILKNSGDFVLLSSIDMAFQLFELQKRAKEGEQRYKELVDEVNDIVFSVDQDGVLTYISPRIKDFTGYEPKEMLGRPLRSLLSEPEPKRRLFTEDEVKKNPTRELKLLSKDGSEIWAEVSSRAIYQHRNFMGARGIMMDITKRVEAEKALKESEAYIQLLAENATDAIFIQSEGKFAYLNKAAMELFGAEKPEDILGTECLLRNPPEFQDQLKDYMYKVNSLKEPTPKTERKYIRLDGSIVDIESSGVPVQYRGKDSGLIFVRDITERKKTEAELKKLNRLFSVRSKISQAIVRKMGISELWKEFCRIAVEEAGFKTVWVATYDETGRYIQPIEYFGMGVEFLQGFKIDTQDPKQNIGPSTTAFQTKEPIFVNDIDQDPKASYWAKLATERNYHSVGSFPLLVDGKVRACINFYSEEKNWFQGEEVELLKALARDISYAIEFAEQDELRTKAEEEIKKLNRVYTVLSDINQTIVRVRDIDDLYAEVCHIAVEKGGFKMAWIGLPDAEGKSMTPIAYAGETKGYLNNLRIYLEEDPYRLGPAATAYHTGEHSIVNNIDEDPRMRPWKEMAVSRGFHASACFPFKVFGKVQGTLNLYSGKNYFFTEEEVNLLDELAMDISYAMEFSIRDKERKRAEKEVKDLLQEKEILLREVHHRIKNDMNTIASLLSLQASSTEEKVAQQALNDAQSRVITMMKIYDALYRSKDYTKISVNDYLTELIRDVMSTYTKRTDIKIQKDIADFLLDSKILFPIGMMVNEILVNSLKYAFEGKNKGTIFVSLRKSGGEYYQLEIGDDGPGLPSGMTIDNSTGFGLGLIRMLCEQIHAKMTVINRNGLHYSIEFSPHY